jgi:general stress protein 26
MTTTDPRAHLIALVKDFDTAMLATRTSGGQLRARPMTLAEVDDDGTVYLVAGLSDPKLVEIEADPQVGLFLQSRTRWASLSGRASVVRDRARIERLWSELWRVWHPRGKDDPDLCLLRIDPSEGEYWDTAGARGVRFVLAAAKAYVTGTTPDTAGIDDNAKVQLG